jgi:hypothetical protein
MDLLGDWWTPLVLHWSVHPYRQLRYARAGRVLFVAD